jgi:DNA polymerase-1
MIIPERLNDLHYDSKEAYQLFHNGILELQRMEQQGFRINRKYINRKQEELDAEIEKIEKDFKTTKFFRAWQHSMKSAVNIMSTQQLGAYLYKVKKIKPPKTTDSGLGATDEEALSQLGIPELNMLLKIKKLKKIKETYLTAFLREQVDGFIHPIFDLHLVKTYRGSSSNPNWQNIPKRDKETMQLVRGAIYPRKGHQLLELDYSQLEVRIAACYHKDPTMIKYINDKSTDMHRDMAVQLFKLKKFDKELTGHSVLRQAAKNGFVFPEFYGDYFVNCAVNLTSNWGQLPKGGIWKPGQGIPFENANLSDHMLKNGFNSLEKYTEHVRAVEKDFWGNRFKVYAKWKEDWYAKYLKEGFVTSLTGFTFQGNMSKNDTSNYPVQSAAFHTLLWSMIEGAKALRGERMKTKIIGQIHDALVIDVYPPELEKVVKIMKCIMLNDVRQHWKWIIVPLDVEAELCAVDKSWAKKEPFEIHKL